MGNTEVGEKMVSVIVPVYNAGKYLGYCLNSVISQTYHNLEIILINDGSTDNSAVICRNYAGIDDRIVIIDTENRGVSRARNTGLEVAKGEYVQFVDSDDVIKTDMVEKFVHTIETYQKDMVICGFDMVTLEQNEVRKIQSLTSDILGMECVLNRKEFFERIAFILWRTSLLESSWNKFFCMRIIRQNNIRFPDEMAYGEDFCFNMEYFQYINGVVFVNDVYYHYLQHNQCSLSKQYREDLFENEMLLIYKFQNLIESNVSISDEEKIELAEYTVSKMMQSLYGLTNEKCHLSVAEKKKEIAKIINDEFVRNAYKIAEYTEPHYEWIRECMDFSDVQKIYNYLFGEKVFDEQMKNQQMENTPQRVIKKPWWLKQMLINLCNLILKIHYFKSIDLIKESLKIRSIKKTVVKGLLKLIGKSKGYDEI